MSKNESLGQRLGQNVRNRRKLKHLTQEKLSELSGVSINTIRNLENGRWPSEHTITSIANALDVEAKILFGGETDQFYLREEVENKVKIALSSILENPQFLTSHIDPRKN
ncbi:helix-turn-helix domain-containing protein [Treponema pectinovorum]|uniref:helix-turn-helix domain-containing protein n=1 Tax=Treponema pectinovorum TaxID=164 RepID=UPI0011C77902|nr:helix-turn-helix transcriptional regulator [Treponema pectinovorum]